jgi:hypothetical protein
VEPEEGGRMSAIAELHTRLGSWLVDREIAVVPEFGEAELHTKTGLARKVVVAPGDEKHALGKFLPPQGTGGEPRRLVTLDELFRVYVAAYDEAKPEDRKAQYVETRALFDLIFAGVFASYRAFQPLDCKWVAGSVCAPFGAALMLTGSVRDGIFDWAEGETLNVAPRTADVTTILKSPDSGVEE